MLNNLSKLSFIRTRVIRDSKFILYMVLKNYYLIILLVSSVLFGNCSSDEVVISDNLDPIEEDLLRTINEFRLAGGNCGSGLSQNAGNLSWNFLLEEIARSHANDMNSNNFFGHEGSNGSTVGNRAADFDYAFSTIGENIANGFTTVESVMDGWINSSSHCELLVNDNFTEVGVVRVNDIWVMVLAAPL